MNRWRGVLGGEINEVIRGKSEHLGDQSEWCGMQGKTEGEGGGGNADGWAYTAVSVGIGTFGNHHYHQINQAYIKPTLPPTYILGPLYTHSQPLFDEIRGTSLIISKKEEPNLSFPKRSNMTCRFQKKQEPNLSFPTLLIKLFIPGSFWCHPSFHTHKTNTLALIDNKQRDLFTPLSKGRKGPSLTDRADCFPSLPV